MASQPDVNDRSAHLRERMVERQIRERGISNGPVLEAMRTVPRHLFVPHDLQASAYDDRPLPIGEGQTISQPYIVARMAELAEIRTDHRVLEIGAGSGYAAAVYAQMGREVVAVEVIPGLAEDARVRLSDLGYDNVTIVTGRAESLPEEESFDRILAAAAAPEIPASFEHRLAEGGRLVLPVGNRFSQHLWTVDRERDRLKRRRHEAVAFVPLV